jgi:hypothetical protein
MDEMQQIDISVLSQMRLDLKAAKQALDMFAERGEEAPQEAVAQVEAMEQMLAAVEGEQRRRLDALAMHLTSEFERCVKARTNVDRRMMQDERQYEGRSRVADPNKRYPNDTDSDSSDDTVATIHATRSFTNLFSARVVDMVLPANEIPFRVDPDPNPDPACIPSFVPPQAQPGEMNPETGEQAPPVEPTPEDIQLAIDDANERAAGKMQNTLKDQLMEGGLQKHGRRAIHDAMRIGVGILRGPFVQYKRRTKVRFTEGAPEPAVEVDELTVPGLAYVNPWYFWYDMTPGLDKARKTFEFEPYDRSEMMGLKKYPNMIVGAIDELLAEPKPCIEGPLAEAVSKRNSELNLVEPLDGRWAVLRVFAAIDPKKLKEIGGIDWPHDNVMPLIEMLMCNGKCLKWKLSELECDYRVPYYAFTPFPCDDTIYGWSVPYMARSAQRTLDGAWEATKLNAAVSSGAMIFLLKSVIQPKDGKWNWGGPKYFDFVPNGIDMRVQDAVQSLVIPSNVEGNLQLVEKAMDNMSQDTMLSQVLQGDISEAANSPASGLVQIINLHTIIQRDIATRFDDGIAQPMPQAYSQWNLLYNDDQGIKGDFNIRATASSAFVAKDVQTQHLQVLTTMAQQPQFAGFTDSYALWQANVEILDVPRKDQICKPRDKALQDQAAMQQSQGDPVVQAKMAELEVQKQKIEADMQIRTQELQLETQRLQTDQQFKMAELQAKIQIAQMDLQRSYVEASAKREIDIASLDAQIDKATSDQAAKSAIEGAKLGQKATHDQQQLELQAAKMAQDAQRITLAQTPSPDSSLD